MKRDQLEHLLRRRPSRAAIASIVFAVAAGIYGIAMMSKANSVADDIRKEKALLTTTQNELTAALAEVKQLKSSLADRDRENQTAVATANDRIGALEAKVGAFAKQAAACETLRAKLGR